MALENRVLMRIFGPKTVEVRGSWIKLHNDELHNLYSLPKGLRWARNLARIGKEKNAIEY
jgi:hypothetical protein